MRFSFAPAVAALAACSTALAEWRLPAINWTAGGIVAPTDQYAIRGFDAVFWPDDSKWYIYSDLVLFSNPNCPGSFGSEIGAFSANSLDGQWTYHGIVASKNTSEADAGGLATPTAIVHNGSVLLYFAYEGLPVGGGLRGIGGARASHPLGPFQRMSPVALAPTGWHRPTGPGGILDDPQVMFYSGRFHLFHSRKHVSDLNCSRSPQQPGAKVVDHCVEWRTSEDGETWQRRGILSPPSKGVAMMEPMSARIYGDKLVVITDEWAGMTAFTTEARGLLDDDPADMVWSAGQVLNNYSGFNSSYASVALRILPTSSPNPTHAALGWYPTPKASQCKGGMTFAVYPLAHVSSGAVVV